MLSDVTYNGGLALSTCFILKVRQKVKILERYPAASARSRPL
jgi:hypothetical protein